MSSIVTMQCLRAQAMESGTVQQHKDCPDLLGSVALIRRLVTCVHPPALALALRRLPWFSLEAVMQWMVSAA